MTRSLRQPLYLALVLSACAGSSSEITSSTGVSQAGAETAPLSAPSPAMQGNQFLDFGATCSSNELCHYEGAHEADTPDGAVTMSCLPGTTLNVLDATYFTASNQQSCLPYVKSACQGQPSCTLSFNNDADRCNGDPDPNVPKLGRATVVCQTSDAVRFGSACPPDQTCHYAGASEGYDPSQNVTMSCPSGTTLNVIDATYYTASSQQSCTAYVTSRCQGKQSCSVLFNDDADHCNGDPNPNVVKSGKATVLCLAPAPTAPLATRFLGRFDFTDPAGPRTSVSGSEMQFGFVGSDLALTIASTQEGNYTVLVDALPATSLRVSASTATYRLPLASPLAWGPHQVRLIRNDEFNLSGVSQLRGVDYGADGAPSNLPPWSGRTIEVLGDSYSNGYGVLSPYPPHPNKPCDLTADVEDEHRSWGALAATNLGTAFREIAISGASSVDVDSVYPFALPQADSAPYDFARQQPADAVAIFLGDNDEAPGAGHGPITSAPPTSYTHALTRLVTRVFRNSPNAHIFLVVYRPDTPKHNTWVEAQFPSQSANGQFHAVPFSLTSSTGLNTCTGHPTKGLHAAWAQAFQTAYAKVFGPGSTSP